WEMDGLDCFFFSSRRRHTRSKRDWSSDVCSSDLYKASASPLSGTERGSGGEVRRIATIPVSTKYADSSQAEDGLLGLAADPNFRSEERRVGKEWRSRRAPNSENEKNKKRTTRATL